MLHFRLLGTAAGGGLPQWNCSCAICALCRQEPQIVPPRYQLQAAVWTNPAEIYLLNASPDLRFQIEANSELQPKEELGRRNTPIRGIVLTSADLDQTLGLLLLREFQPLTVYATAVVRASLLANPFFRMLERVPNQLTWVEIRADEPFSLGLSGIVCTPMALVGDLPFYARGLGLDEAQGASLGLMIEHNGQRLAYTPSVPEVTAQLHETYRGCDTILVDGTFWSDAELQNTHAGTPLARSIGHVPMSGEDGTMALLASLARVQKVFVHLNNTNPVLDPRSAEANEVLQAGWEIGYDGWEIAL